MKRHVHENVLDDLHKKYITLTTNLKKVFKEKEDHYSAKDIITNLCTADKKNLTFFSAPKCFRTVKTVDEVFYFIGGEENANISIMHYLKHLYTEVNVKKL